MFSCKSGIVLALRFCGDGPQVWSMCRQLTHVSHTVNAEPRSHHRSALGHFHRLRKNPRQVAALLHASRRPPALGWLPTHFLYLDLPLLDIAYQWHRVLPRFTHAIACITQEPSIVRSHHVQFICSPVDGRLGCVLFGCREECCYERVCTCFCVGCVSSFLRTSV